MINTKKITIKRCQNCKGAYYFKNNKCQNCKKLKNRRKSIKKREKLLSA